MYLQLKKRTVFIAIILVAFIAGVAFAGGIIFASGKAWLNPVQASQTSQSQSGTALPGVGPNTIADTVDRVGPAVVKIDTTITTSYQGDNPFLNDPFFRQFFGEQFSQPRTQVQKGLGSGFLISADGYILTNQHVIDGATSIQVTLVGKSNPYTAKVVGSDRELDLAVLKIDGSGLPYLKLGNSDQISVGNWVIAIGNPYGLDHTVTVGVISAKGRPVTVEDRTYKNLLQTDASINPGNSGGPLLNLQGEVIGINTAVNAQAQGIGFAIPSNTVSSVLSELMGSGKITRGWLGIEMQNVTQGIAQYLGYSGQTGVVVRDVLAASPAYKAGLQQGDIITSINGSSINNTDDLSTIIERSSPGTRVTLTVWRNQKSIKIPVTLGERPQDQ